VVQHGRPHLVPKTRQPSNRDHTVVRFRRRYAGTGEPAKRSVVRSHEPNVVFLLSLAKYESDGEEDDYRRRMIENGLAFVVTLALIAMGVWLASNLHD
jgi:hypothetical protein